MVEGGRVFKFEYRSITIPSTKFNDSVLPVLSLVFEVLVVLLHILLLRPTHILENTNWRK